MSGLRSTIRTNEFLTENDYISIQLLHSACKGASSRKKIEIAAIRIGIVGN